MADKPSPKAIILAFAFAIAALILLSLAGG